MRWAALWRQAPRCGHVLRLPVWSSYLYGAVLELFLNLPLHPRHPRFQFGFIANRSRRKRHVNHLGFDLLGGFALGLLETLRQRIALGLPHLQADSLQAGDDLRLGADFNAEHGDQTVLREDGLTLLVGELRPGIGLLQGNQAFLVELLIARMMHREFLPENLS